MSSHAGIAALLRELYTIGAHTLQPIARVPDAARLLLLAERADGSAWVVKGYRTGAALPEPFAGTGAADLPAWLADRAALLATLERQAYPAPRLVPTRDGAPVGLAGAWLTQIATYLPGPSAQPTLPQIEQIGAALGQLHTLGPAGCACGSWWHLPAVLPHMRAWLAEGYPAAPEWADLHAECAATAEAIAQAVDLPVTLIHGDAWAANAVQVSPDQTVLIDWEVAGLGLAVLDFGALLVDCHVDLDQPNNGLIALDPARVEAAVAGYCRWRRPTPAECAVLPAAIRFGVAYLAAWHFALATRHGYDAAIARRLARARNRFTLSTAMAEIALGRIAAG